MKHIINQCLAAILSVAMAFSLLPAAAMAEESGEAPEKATVEQVQSLIDALPDADTITADNRADVEAQLAAIDEAKLELTEDEAAALDTARYDAAVAALSALDAQPADPDPQPSAVEQVQSLIDALPDADTITAENRDDVEAQLTAIDEAKLALEDEELDTLDTTRYMAAVEAILALDGMAGANEPRTIANNVSYVDANGSSQTQGSAIDITSNTKQWTTGWYVVSNTVKITSIVEVIGDVHLILQDGKTLTADNGIHVSDGNSLTIYGQSRQNGKLLANIHNINDPDRHYAAIGGGSNESGGTIIINGGNITAKNEGSGGAGIGGGWKGSGGTITINGGTVTATSSVNGAAIGGGSNTDESDECNGGIITINGGTVIATTPNTDSAAIGGGRYGDGGTITITGGTVTATSGGRGAGIGGGKYSNGGTITINGGTITAESHDYGAAIGGGGGEWYLGGEGGEITITGGTITATSGSGAKCSIGGGTSEFGNQPLSGSGTFSTGTSGKAVIYANKGIQDTSGKSSWSGIIFEGNEGTVYGNQTLAGSFEVKAGETLNIPNESSLNVTGKVTNKGTIDVWGVLEGDSKITNVDNGKIVYHYDPQVTAPTFDNAKYGYSEPGAQSITIRNNGGVSIDITEVKIEGNDFEFTAGTLGTLKKGESNETWKIKPKAGLEAGEHTATITVSYIGTASKESGTLTAQVSFTVTKANANLTVAPVPAYTYGTDGGITLTATVAPVVANGISLMKAEENQVVFAFPKGGKTETQTVDAGGGTVTVNIPVGQVKDYFNQGVNTVTVSYGGSINLEQKESVEVTVTVNPKTLTFDFTATPRAYDQTTNVTGNFTLDGVMYDDEVEVDEYTATVDDANAGQDKAVTVKVTKLKGSEAGYYTPGTANGGTVDISKAKINSVTTPTVTNHTYNGQDQALLTGEASGVPESATITYFVGAKGDTSKPSGNEDTGWGDMPTTKAKDAGTYTVWYKVTGGMNYEDIEPTRIGEATIEQKPVTLTWSGHTGLVYTGTAKDVTATFPDNEIADGDKGAVSVSVTNGDRVEANPDSTYIATATLEGSRADNYTLTNNTQTYTISKATASVAVSASDTPTYGENITLTATVTVSDVAASNITGTVEFKVGDTTLGTVKVEGGVATLTISDSQRNEQHTLFGSTGSTNVTAKYNGDSNIDEGNDDATVNITPKVLTYTVTATGKVYDGDAAVVVQLVPNNLVPGDSVTLTASGSLSSADAATYYTVDLSGITKTGADEKYYSVDNSASDKELQGGVTISPKVVELVWKLDNDKTFTISYDGKPHTATATVNNKVNSDEVGVTVEVKPDSGTGAGPYNATATDAGNYTATATELTGTAKGNYTLEGCTTATQTITISKVLATCVAPTANNSTYTGGTQALVTAGAHTGGTMMYALGESGSVEPGDEKFSETIPSETDAGKYYVWYYVKADTNHTDSAKGYVEVTIKKAEVTFTVTGNDVPYDTNAHTATVTQTENESPKLSPTDFSVTYGPDKTANKTNVGEYDIYVTLKNNNFKFEGQEDTVREMELSDKLTINQAELTLTIDPVTITYGDELADTLLSGKATIDGDTEIPGTWAWQEQRDTYPKPSDASHNYVAVFTPDDPYKGNFEPSTLQKTVTITVNRKTLTPSIDTVKNIDQFSGETGTTGTLTLTGAVLSEEPTATGTFNFDDPKAGENKSVSVTGITLSGSWSDNYELSVDHLDNVTTTASIGKRVVELEWKLNGADNFTVTYSGKAVNVAATVTNLVSGYDCTVTVTDGGKTDAGTYTATASLSDPDNYTLPTDGTQTKEYTIAKSVVTFVEHNGTATYDTQPHKVTLDNTTTGGAPTLTEGDYTVHYAASGQDFETGAETETKAGTYDVWVKLSGEAFANYEFEGKAQTANVGTLKVEQAKLELTVKDVTITYGTALNNAQLTGSTAKIEGENGATITGTWSWANEGDFPAVSDSKSTNYKVTFTPDTQFAGNFVETTLSTETTITVNKYVLTPVVVANSVDSKIYDGTTTVTGGALEFTDMGIFNKAPFKDTKPTISGAFAYTGPNAGTNTVNVTDIHFDKNGENYSLSTDKIDSSTVDGAITAKEVVLSWALDGETELTTGYTGAEHTVTATATTGVGSETVNVTVTGGTQTNAGSYIATASALTNGENGGLAANYKLPSVVTQGYTVTPAPVSFTIGKEDKVEWTARGETNADPNPDGYVVAEDTTPDDWTDHVLSMTYDSYNHKAAVTQTAGEAVKIEAGTTNGYTVTYRKDGAGDDLTEIRDAGTYEIWVTLTPTEDNIYNYAFTGHEGNRALKIGAITVEPYETAVSWTHLKYVYHGHAMHPDIHVLSPFKADDVQMSGGLPADFDHEHPEAYTGDYLVAFAETGDSVVGSYTVTAKLYGKNAGNYTVTDLTEDVTIIPAPVTILVGDNTWVMQEDGTLSRNTVTLRPTWGAVTAAPDQDEGTDHQYPAAGSAITAALDMTVEYRKDGETVVGAPTEPGTYEVWVTIGNNNFRHSAATDGAPHNVGELVVTDRPESISTYTVTFDPGYEGAPAGPAELSGIFANQTVVIPPISGENEDGTRYDLTRPGYSFLGWSYDGRIYQPNEELYMPAADVTFTAEWTDAVALNGQILRESGSGDPVPVSGATVVLKHGSEEVAETVTDRSGAFDFGRVTPGIYNLEVTCENGSDAKIVKTFLVVLEDGGIVGGEYILPDVALNTVVEVIPSITAAVDMGGIVSGEDIVDVYTSEDRETVRSGGTVEFKMSISGAELTPDQTQELPVPEDRIGMALDLELTKTVSKRGGDSTEIDIHDTKIPVSTAIHLPAELQGKSGYTVYRFHDTDGDGIDEMQTITTSPNENGEYLEVIREGTAIELHAEFYSTYVLTWNQITNSSYRVTLPAATANGRLTSDRTMASRGRAVTLTATPDEGCHLRSLTVTDKNGNAVELTAGGDGTYTFVQPASRVTVEAEFVKCLSMDYTDIDLDAWYHEYTDRVIESGLMLGVGDGVFAPNGTVTRAQMVTALWHMSGDAETDYDMDYTDVSEGDWYAEAVRWATSVGVAGGYGNSKFGPNDPITREQMATMLYRYEQNLGNGGFTGEWMYRLPFTDLEGISDWAFEAVAWCNMEEIVLGRENDTFDPQGKAKRSEMAAILTRWSETNEK